MPTVDATKIIQCLEVHHIHISMYVSSLQWQP